MNSTVLQSEVSCNTAQIVTIMLDQEGDMEHTVLLDRDIQGTPSTVPEQSEHPATSIEPTQSTPLIRSSSLAHSINTGVEHLQDQDEQYRFSDVDINDSECEIPAQRTVDSDLGDLPAAAAGDSGT